MVIHILREGITFPNLKSNTRPLYADSCKIVPPIRGLLKMTLNNYKTSNKP